MIFFYWSIFIPTSRNEWKSIRIGFRDLSISRGFCLWKGGCEVFAAPYFTERREMFHLRAMQWRTSVFHNRSKASFFLYQKSYFWYKKFIKTFFSLSLWALHSSFKFSLEIVIILSLFIQVCLELNDNKSALENNKTFSLIFTKISL